VGEAVFERHHGYSTPWTLQHLHQLADGVPNGFLELHGEGFGFKGFIGLKRRVG